MEITPRELRDAEIAEAFRGYNREVVNDLLERAAASIDAGNARVSEVSERLKSAQLEADRSRETEDILHRTLLLAQRAADEAVAEAQQKAREMMEEAELESHKLRADAQTEAQRRRDDERERLEEEVVDLAARRDTLLSDVDALTQFESEYRARLSGVLESDLAMLRDRPASAPGPVPQSHEVELPVASEAFARSDVADTYVDAAPLDDASYVDADTDTERDTDTPSQSVTDFFGAPETTHEVAAEVGPATREVDMTALFDADAPEAESYAPPGSYETPASFESQYAPPAAADTADTADTADAPVASDAPFGTEPGAETGVDFELPNTDTGFDMLRPDVLDSEVLDDDAFFATLREAVHDESPLGPREEGGDESDFYGDDAEKASFRDVFRRRR